LTKFFKLRSERESWLGQAVFTKEQIKLFLLQARNIMSNTDREKRILIKAFVEKVYVYDGDVRDELKIQITVGDNQYVRVAGAGSPAPCKFFDFFSLQDPQCSQR
jgi:hypothetical protein